MGFHGVIAKSLGMVIFAVWIVEKLGRHSGLFWNVFIGSLAGQAATGNIDRNVQDIPGTSPSRIPSRHPVADTFVRPARLTVEDMHPFLMRSTHNTVWTKLREKSDNHALANTKIHLQGGPSEGRKVTRYSNTVGKKQQWYHAQ
ncbi:hypothetical protein LZ31DRAFT_596521 [Colletotrichum somersetense]|nr:hypothetical protein LZ31DRAFT_596521 [Colletotrichum somersetense]